MSPSEDYARRGHTRFAASPDTLAWARAAHPVACRVTADTAQQAQWLQCEGTWFVGVDALPNAPDGAIDGVPLHGPAIDWLTGRNGSLPPLHAAQLSVMYPGYPRPREGESEAAFRYRKNRDAAHVDGLLAEGPGRRRSLKEPHIFILGLPLNDCDPEASPLVVWEGSHHIMRRAFAEAFGDVPGPARAELDITEIYQAARREAFETCPRVALPAQPGEAQVLHPMVLHGVAPWGEAAQAPPEGRMIAYFRPEAPGGIAQWLTL